MIVLGLSPLDKDATVSIVADGRVLFAAAEERYSRVKQHAGFPHRALADALARTGIALGDIDVVAYPFLEWKEEARLTFLGVAGPGAWIRARSSTPT